MKKIGIWIDSREALIVEIMNGGVKAHTIPSDLEKRPRFEGETSLKTRSAIGFDFESKQQARYNKAVTGYLQQVVNYIRNSEAVVYLTGPGEMKKNLEKLILKVKKLKVLKTAPLDKLTYNQKIEQFRQFFAAQETKRK